MGLSKSFDIFIVIIPKSSQSFELKTSGLLLVLVVVVDVIQTKFGCQDAS